MLHCWKINTYVIGSLSQVVYVRATFSRPTYWYWQWETSHWQYCKKYQYPKYRTKDNTAGKQYSPLRQRQNIYSIRSLITTFEDVDISAGLKMNIDKTKAKFIGPEPLQTNYIFSIRLGTSTP